MVASTVSRSSEEFTARSTSSSAWSSATERVSSAVRSRNVPEVGDAGDGDDRLFGEGLQQGDLAVGEAAGFLALSAIAPIAAPSRSNGIDTNRLHAEIRSIAGSSSGSASTSRMWTICRSRIARPAIDARVGAMGNSGAVIRRVASGSMPLQHRSEVDQLAIEFEQSPPTRRCTVPARGGRSGRTPAGCRRARPTSPSARRWSRTAARSARRIRCCAAASAAVRACNSRYVSALPMAITACSAKVCSSATWLSEKPPGRLASERDRADRRTVAQQRHATMRLHPPMCSRPAKQLGLGVACSRIWIDVAVDRIARPNDARVSAAIGNGAA